MSDLSQKSVEQAVAEIWGASKTLKATKLVVTRQGLTNALNSNDQRLYEMALKILLDAFDGYTGGKTFNTQKEYQGVLLQVVKDIIAGKEGAIETAKEVIGIIEGEE
jgi:hypothetical protein